MTNKIAKPSFFGKGFLKKFFRLDWISSLDSHHRLFISMFVTLAGFLILKNKLDISALIITTWILYATSITMLAWITIFKAHPKNIRYIASIQDTGRRLIFVFVIIATIASMLSVIILLKSTQTLSVSERYQHVLLSVTSVVLSWLLVHTVFTLRYAHLYYGTNSKTNPPLGLEFPMESNPDYLDFAYFSFVIGMTCQVSDVQITCRPIRRLALLHGIIAFAFNAIVVALAINIISGLLEK